ncbi:hypothetical protein IIV6-T1_210 [Invertebrate iridescent virus 6]|nr:hypothetical protein IIV6-T1_210 [Invertebrate iridescent virus 6]
MEMNQKTAFMGINIKDEGPSNVMIIKALNSSSSLLDIPSFMKVAGIEFDPIMFNHFWQVLVDNGDRLPHVGETTLNWLGYEGVFTKQKEKFINMLKRNQISFKELSYQDNEIQLYPSIQKEMLLLPNESAKTKSKWLLMNPDDFKMAIMGLKTKNSEKIKRYYVTLEKTMKLHSEYALYFHDRKAKEEKERERQRSEDEKRSILGEMSEMRQYMQKMGITLEDTREEVKKVNIQNKDIKAQNEEIKAQNEELAFDLSDVRDRLMEAAEDRSPKLETKPLRERFVIIKRKDSSFPYYAIRGQDVYVKGRLTHFKNTRYPELKIIFDTNYQPNPRNLYIRFKELKDERFIIAGNNIKTVDSSNKLEKEMLELFEKLNEEKHNI